MSARTTSLGLHFQQIRIRSEMGRVIDYSLPRIVLYAKSPGFVRFCVTSCHFSVFKYCVILF